MPDEGCQEGGLDRFLIKNVRNDGEEKIPDA